MDAEITRRPESNCLTNPIVLRGQPRPFSRKNRNSNRLDATKYSTSGQPSTWESP